MKKLAFIYDAIYPYQMGGVEKRIYSISQLLKKKYSVHLVGMKSWEGDNTLHKDGIYYHGIFQKMPMYKKNGVRRIDETLIYSYRLVKFLLKNNFDIIDCQATTSFPVFAVYLVNKLKRNQKIFITYHEYWEKDYWIMYMGKIKGTLGYIIQKITLYLSKNIIAVSEDTKNRIKKYTKNKIHIIPNGLEQKEINKIKKEKKEYDLVYAGRLHDFKNVDKIIKTVKVNPKLNVVIIGTGPELENLKKMSKGLKIKFTGFLKDQIDVYKYMSKSKIFMMLSEREGFSIVTLEALALGVPVICYNNKNNPAKYLIQNYKNGILIKSMKINIIYKAINTIESKYKNYSYNAQTSVKEYYLENIIKSLLNTYEN